MDMLSAYEWVVPDFCFVQYNVISHLSHLLQDISSFMVAVHCPQNLIWDPNVMNFSES